MKNKTIQLFHLFYGFLIASLICSTNSIAQESPQPNFLIGPEFTNNSVDNTIFYQPFYESGMNFISQRANFDTTWQFVKDYDMLASNSRYKHEYIYHYSTSYYSKWEAEVDAESDRIGFKHRDSLGYVIGSSATWNGKSCWSSLGLSGPRDSLMYGPHYRQEKRYKRWLYWCYNEPGCVTYTPRFQMALHNPSNVDDNEDVCVIKVVFRYKNLNDDLHYDSTFIERTLKVGDFDTSGNFSDFYLHPEPGLGLYEYPTDFILPKNLGQMVDGPSMLNYTDSEAYTGIQFWVDWLRDDTLCTLYIDYVEVYDNSGWNEYIETPGLVTARIQEYAESFNHQNWENIKYWLGTDEPYSIDCYEPIRVVDSLIRLVNPNAPLLVSFNPSWSWDHKINGESEITQYLTRVDPQKFLLAINPCAEWWPRIRVEDHEWMRHNFQLTHSLHPDFWYAAQSHGYKIEGSDPVEWCIWRKPEPEEMRSMVTLALAHGAKGIIFKWFDSYGGTSLNCSAPIYFDAIVDEMAEPTPLYDEIKNNLAPRLTGTLGKTLMKLEYTGNYINVEYQEGPLPENEYGHDYLAIQHYGMSYFWHAGFFNQKGHLDNKYFLLTNLRTNYQRESELIITNNTDYENVSFIDIEGGVDTTIGFNSSITYNEIMPPGDGRLYRVSPVVLYGGRFIYDEYAGEDQILADDMIIENGKTLSISGDYYAHANIIVKDGTILNYNNGAIHFAEGKSLIVDGYCTLSGSGGNKLKLIFTPSQSDEISGITIKAGSTLNISCCEVENANVGIQSLVNAQYLNAQYVDFINCGTHSINILGYSGGEQLPPPPPIIKYCNISNSDYGISVSNLSQIVIQQNNITGTDYGIFLTNVSNPAIIGNNLSGTKEAPGIFLGSCNGVVRGNWITSHTNGIHLGNSSPDIGGNIIHHNLNRGIYVGVGSLPNMEGRLVQDPTNPNIFYAVSGYNQIYENGGWTEEDDGSEIFVTDANLILRRGCNEILDQRIPNVGETPPLYNTQLLMNCEGSYQLIEIYADENYWGVHPIYPLEERFGNCIVYYEPYREEPCPQPDGSGGKLPITSKSGEVIDTLYADQRTIGTLTETEEQYAIAEENFLTGDLSGAMQTYESIITGNATDAEKYFAYQRKYEIGRLTGQPPEFFNTLGSTFLSIAASAQDSVTIKLFTQLSILCKVSEEEYLESINQFDGIVQQNPNTEEAVYAEIDALTTALLIEEADSTLQKGRLGKYLVKNSNDYSTKVDEILKKHFGGGTIEKEEEVLPTEFTLYQNFPNPFNPETVIKYDLPDVSDVSLTIYDILGRKVKELVNTKQEAGRYEVQFNATSLASGVYIYQLIADKFISSKKMILLK